MLHGIEARGSCLGDIEKQVDDETIRRALFFAVSQGKFYEVQTLTSNMSKEQIRLKNENGETALSLALRKAEECRTRPGREPETIAEHLMRRQQVEDYEKIATMLKLKLGILSEEDCFTPV